MSDVRPFPGAVVDPAWAARVVSPMHDTLSLTARAEILATNPYSYLHVTREPGEGEDVADAMADNAAALRRLVDAGAFRRSAVPAMYVYRLRGRGRAQTGIVAEIPVEAFASGTILGHEAVRLDRVDALAQHFAWVPARSDLVALMHARDVEVEGVVKACCDGPPILDIPADDGLEQTVWRIEEAVAHSLVAARLGPQTLYITDGHHRVAAWVRRWEDAGRPPHRRVLCVLFPEEELRVLAVHRRVVGPVDAARTLDRLGELARLEADAGPRRDAGTIGLYCAGRWHVVEFPAGDLLPGRAGLDVTRLHAEILEPVFDVKAADDTRLELISELVPLEELVARCDADGGALFQLAPPSLAQITNVADRGEVMPPKATYFDPKPRSGVFLRFERDFPA